MLSAELIVPMPAPRPLSVRRHGCACGPPYSSRPCAQLPQAVHHIQVGPRRLQHPGKDRHIARGLPGLGGQRRARVPQSASARSRFRAWHESASSSSRSASSRASAREASTTSSFSFGCPRLSPSSRNAIAPFALTALSRLRRPRIQARITMGRPASNPPPWRPRRPPETL